MKIRCEENSIRLRLRKSEIEQLKTELSVRTEAHFSQGRCLSWELWIDLTAEIARADTYGSHISVVLPHDLAMQWIDSEEVGIEFFQPIDKARKLHVLVEKDFPCKTRPDENKADFFGELVKQTNLNC